ncbi:hypothetical protein EMCG_03300 [[Emmonsia] crescens]|uniref:Uncharacterized protein n=1 Tax=[Emmonsia] crescens TaxID=73230 RepID=A0A0G2HVX5_9EURO|nr:hypothetical protein EMCG_03300 [Emmonsia crescens UAMH 3008]
MRLHRLLKTVILHICQTLPCTTRRQTQICPSKLHVNILIPLLCHSNNLRNTLPNSLLRNSPLNIILAILTIRNNNNKLLHLLLRPYNINTNLNLSHHEITLRNPIINPWANLHLHTSRNNKRDTLWHQHSPHQNDKYNPTHDHHPNHSRSRNPNIA